MRFVSLFAGVGGFDLGFEHAGMTCVGQVEIDKHARAVLNRHWPDVPKHDDVTTAREWADECGLVGAVDIVAGGFPCQDVSVAGKRAGLAGERTGLFWDALAFTTHVEAGWIVLENVPGLLSSNKGRDFGVVVTALADAGYRHVEWRVLDSQFFGVPQRRRRVFVVATSDPAAGRTRPVLVEPEGLRWDHPQSGAQGPHVAGTVAGGTAGRSVAATLNSGGNDGGFRTEPGEHLVVVDGSLSLSRQQQQHAAGSQHGDDRHGSQVRPGYGVASRPIADKVGTLSGGAHPGGFNGQDAYTGQLVVCEVEAGAVEQ